MNFGGKLVVLFLLLPFFKGVKAVVEVVDIKDKWKENGEMLN